MDTKDALALAHEIAIMNGCVIESNKWQQLHYKALTIISPKTQPLIEWECPLRDVSDCPDHPQSKYLGTLLIAGIAHHIEAWEVHDVQAGDQFNFVHQEAVCPDQCNYNTIVDHMTDGPGATVELFPDRHYFIVVTPFQE